VRRSHRSARRLEDHGRRLREGVARHRGAARHRGGDRRAVRARGLVAGCRAAAQDRARLAALRRPPRQGRERGARRAAGVRDRRGRDVARGGRRSPSRCEGSRAPGTARRGHRGPARVSLETV
ncbi:MAG: Bacterial ribosome SSU maturation protein RimP, partial [uncultured Gemmatimonadaceae bacterium]